MSANGKGEEGRFSQWQGAEGGASVGGATVAGSRRLREAAKVMGDPGWKPEGWWGQGGPSLRGGWGLRGPGLWRGRW